MSTGVVDQPVFRGGLRKGTAVNGSPQFLFAFFAVKQPPVVFPDILRVMDGKRRPHLPHRDGGIAVPLIRIGHPRVSRAENRHASHRPAVSVAPPGSLNDGVQRSQGPVHRPKIQVYTRFDALGRHHPARKIVFQPLPDALDLLAPMSGAQIRGKVKDGILGAELRKPAGDLPRMAAQINNGADAVLSGHLLRNGFQRCVFSKPPIYHHPLQGAEHLPGLRQNFSRLPGQVFSRGEIRLRCRRKYHCRVVSAAQFIYCLQCNRGQIGRQALRFIKQYDAVCDVVELAAGSGPV